MQLLGLPSRWVNSHLFQYQQQPRYYFCCVGLGLLSVISWNWLVLVGIGLCVIICNFELYKEYINLLYLFIQPSSSLTWLFGNVACHIVFVLCGGFNGHIKPYVVYQYYYWVVIELIFALGIGWYVLVLGWCLVTLLFELYNCMLVLG